MTVTRITIANWDSCPEKFDQQAETLAAHVLAAKSEMVLLPEMPFTPWLPQSRDFDSKIWHDSVEQHLECLEKLGKHITVTIAASRPIVETTSNHNRSFFWKDGAFLTQPHDKQDLPEEPYFWERSWYSPGPKNTPTFTIDNITFGFLICTEIWNMERNRKMLHHGAHVLLTPRATPYFDGDVWVAGVRVAAFTSGCYVLSSNRIGPINAELNFEGLSAASDPDGTVMGVTSEHTPYITVEIDTAVSEAASETYPRYVWPGK